MHSIEIEKLINARLLALPNLDLKRVAWVNQNFTIPKAGLWIRPTVLGGINFMSGMSDKPCSREVGTVIVQCFDREGQGTGNLKRFADALAQHLAYYKADKLELLTPSIIDAGFDPNTKFYQINVSIGYRYN